MQWFQDNRELFISLGSRYTKKTPMEQSFYAYFVGQYKLCGRSREDAITAQMLLFVIQSSIYSCEFVAFRYREVLKSIPVAVVWGNHESSQTGMDKQFERFGGAEHNYYFTYRNVLFFAINTNSKNYEEQLEYLKKAIKSTSAEWTVVMMHYSMFGGKDRSQAESVMNTRAAYAYFH